MARDFYAILNIQKDASDEEIKKAYRKMALKWHPDKNITNKEMAERIFKEVNQAYEVLSDRSRRENYDRYGTIDNSNIGFNPFTFHNPYNIFKQFFGSDPFEDDGFFPTFNRPFSNRMHSDFSFGNSFGGGISELFSDSSHGVSNFNSVKTVTRIENGKKMTTKETTNNNVVTTEIYENDRLISRDSKAVNYNNKKNDKYIYY